MILRNKELIEILQKHPPELPIIITRMGKGDDFGVEANDIEVREGAYFGNYDTHEEFEEDQKFLRVGVC